MLTFVYSSNLLNPSFDPVDSDLWANTVILENLVGTLVKFNSNGNYETYLADTWSVSNDGLKWTFKFKQQIFSDDGEIINAKTYKNSLLRLLKLYSKKGNVPVFSDVKGWPSFLTSNKDLEGVNVVNDSVLEINFIKKIDGVLEFLAMPYYGFYSSVDFDENGKWKNRQQITSTGPYKLIHLNSEEVVLESRKNWHDYNKLEVQKLRYLLYKNLEKPLNSKVIYVYSTKLNLDENEFNLVKGIPGLLKNFILNSEKINVFNNVENRLLFLSEFREFQKREILKSKNGRMFQTFFAVHDKYLHEVVKPQINKITQKNKIKIAFSYKASDAENEFLNRFFKYFFTKYNLEYEITVLDRTKPKATELFESNKVFDIKYATVDIGGSIENWLVKMIFCSKMGANYPDPSKRICNLVHEIETKNNHSYDENYIKEFNKIIAEDAAVVPVMHTSPAWYISKDIDISNFGVSITEPRMDEIKLVR